MDDPTLGIYIVDIQVSETSQLTRRFVVVAGSATDATYVAAGRFYGAAPEAIMAAYETVKARSIAGRIGDYSPGPMGTHLMGGSVISVGVR